MSTSIYDDQDTDDHIVGDSIMPDGSHDDLGSTEDERLNEINALEAAYRGKDDDGRGKNSDKSLDENSLREAEEGGLDTTAAESSGEKKQLAEKVGSEVGDNGKDYFNSGVKKKAAKGMLTKKKSLLWIGSGGLLLSVALGFLMFMTIYRSEHLRNLLWDYRFAKFHRQVAKRIKSNLLVNEGLSETSPEKVATFEKTSLYEKMRGYSPEKAFSKLGQSGMAIEIDKTGRVFGFRESRITAFTDPATGEKVYSNRANNVPAGGEVLSTTDFADRLTASSSKALEGTSQSKFFQKQTRKMLRDKVGIKFGDRFKAYKEKLKARLAGENKEPTDEERRRALTEADAERARGSPETTKAKGILEEPSKEVPGDISNQLTGPDLEVLTSGGELGVPTITPDAPPVRTKWIESKTRAKLIKGSGAYAEFSSFVFLTTMGCILKDVSQTIQTTLTTRIEAPMRMTANMFGEAEQLKSNDNVEMGAMEQRNKQYDGVETSAAFQRINGTPEAEIPESSKLEVADLPFTFFGMDLGTVSTLAGLTDRILTGVATAGVSEVPIVGEPIGDLAGGLVDEFCSKMLNPWVQGSIAVVDVIALIVSLGSSESIAQGVVQGIKAAVQIAGSVGLMKVVFEYFLPKLLFAMAGSGGILSQGDPQNGNKMDLGATLLSSQYDKMAGGTEITGAQAQRDQEEAMAAVKQQYVDEQGAFASINPANPYSITSQFALSLPADPFAALGTLLAKSLGSSLKLKPLSGIAALLSPKAKAAEPAYFETYGVPQYGIPDSLINVDPIDNANEVDGGDPAKLKGLIDKYLHCFDTSLAEQELQGSFGNSNADFGICGDADAQKLSLYIIDNCAAEFTSEGVDANNCSILPGAGDVTEGSESSTATTTASSGMVGALPEWESTTACPSDPDITDGGMGSAKRDGRDVPFKLCNVMGFGRFNTVYASNFLGVFKSAKEAGFDLRSGGGSYRSYKAAADEWKNRCGDRDYSLGFDSPPCTGSKMAPPGKSNHELGLAADLTCPGVAAQLGGGTETRSTFRREDPCVKWVLENSPQFGLVLQCDGKKADGSFLFGEDCESWHLSPTGG